MSADSGSITLKTKLTPEKRELLKRTICRGATDDEFDLFVAVCNRTGLDPFTRQIHAVKRKMKNPETGDWEEVMVHQTGIDGYRLTAQRSGEYAGQDPHMWCAADGVWVDVWLKEEPPHAAKGAVYREGIEAPFVNVALYSAYVQRKTNGDPMARWKTDPAGMLAKCAEAGAIRKAFPNEVADIYTNEEMGQADNPEGAPTVQQPQRASARDAGTVDATKAPPKEKAEISSPFLGVVAKVTQKKGGTEEKPWTLYTVHAAEPGKEGAQKFTTFKKDLAQVAKDFAKAAEEVKFHIEKNDKGYWNLTGIEAVDAAPED
jgi:phage recombination protein Bet